MPVTYKNPGRVEFDGVIRRVEGGVSTKQDAELALLAVRGVSGSFSAKSNLKIEK